MKRVLLAMVLVLALLLSVSVLSFAEEKQVELQYNVPASYTFEIPAAPVALGSDGGSFRLSMTGNIESLNVKIRSEYGFNLKNPSVEYPIGYTISDESGSLDAGSIIKVYDGIEKWISVSLCSDDVASAKAGTYADTLTFTVQ